MVILSFRLIQRFVVASLLAAAPFACSGDDEEEPEFSSCEDFTPAAATPVTIRITNERSTAVDLAGTCGAGDSAIRIDGGGVFVSLARMHCRLQMECTATGCEGAPSVTIPPGGSIEETWSGHVFTSAPVQIPDECRSDCHYDTSECKPLVVAAPGAHVLRLNFSGEPAGEVELPFSLPATELVVTIPP
jgi:hypothetical protein